MPWWGWLIAGWLALDCAFVLLWSMRRREPEHPAGDDDEAATLAALARAREQEEASRELAPLSPERRMP